jgi:hypothetical protein
MPPTSLLRRLLVGFMLVMLGIWLAALAHIVWQVKVDQAHQTAIVNRAWTRQIMLNMQSLPSDPAALARIGRGIEALRLDMFREADLRDVLAHLDAAGVRPLMMKGGELAYTHYARPDLRPRVDTDLLIAPAMREAADATLCRLGYRREVGVAGDFVSYQTTYIRTIEGRAAHVLDVHWRVANPQMLSNVLQYDELAAEAIPILQLGPAARGLSAVHALIMAAVHRVAHHDNSDSLIWLYDIHLVASRFDGREWSRLIDEAVQRGVAAILADSLRRAQRMFGTIVPASTFEALAPAGAQERSASFLAGERRHVTSILRDLRALPSWGARLRLAREHVIPSSTYMRGVYAPGSSMPLGMLYCIRAWRGARRWFVRVDN